MLGIVVHKDIVAFLRILPEVENLRHRCDIRLRPFPAEVGIHRQAAGFRAVIAAQVKHRLIVTDARRPRGQLIFSEVEPGGTRIFTGTKQYR